jgi:cytochrome d ubiquinol oxidase subunit II
VAAALVALALAAVSLATLYLHPRVSERWGFMPGGIDWSRLALLAPIPLLGLVGLATAAWGLARRSHRWPFAGAVMVFLSGYFGLAVGFMPYVVPYALTYGQAAAADNALALLGGGLAVMLPLILGYTVWVYWVFRGKVAAGAGYH